MLEVGLHSSPTAKGAVTSIFCLPPELLQDIFLSQEGFIVEQYSNVPSHACISSRGPCRPYCWMAVAHVCRHWRTVALACPSLWTRFSISAHPMWTMELLRRSGNAPLSIKYRLPDGRSQWDTRLHSFAIVLGHLSRIEKLDIIQRSSSPLPPAIIGMLSGRAPQLRSLLLDGALFMLEPDAQSEPEATYVPGLLHPENTPRLEHFTLSGSYGHLRFTGPCASTLKHLHFISVPHSHFLQWPNARALLEVLSAAPLLETLYFERRPPWSIFVPHEGLKHATLPRLHALTLATEDDEIATLLTHLDLPALRCLEISSVLALIDAAAFTATLESKLATLGAMHDLSVEVSPSARRSSMPSLQIGGYATDPRPAIPTDELTRHRIFTLNLQRCPDAMQIAGEVCQRMVLYDVGSLEIEAYDVPEFFWAAVLEPVHSLARLIVGGRYAAIRLPEALYSRRLDTHTEDTGNPSVHDTTGEAETPRLPVPALRILQLDRVCLDRRADYDVGTLGAYSGSLCESLRARGEAGARLEELALDSCLNVNEAALIALRDVMEGMNGCTSVTACGGTMDTGFWDVIV